MDRVRQSATFSRTYARKSHSNHAPGWRLTGETPVLPGERSTREAQETGPCAYWHGCLIGASDLDDGGLRTHIGPGSRVERGRGLNAEQSSRGRPREQQIAS